MCVLLLVDVQLTKRRSQHPLSKKKGQVQTVAFHPNKPIFFVATQRSIRVYDLMRQELIKKLLSTARWISSIDVHPDGEHVIAGSYDKRTLWFDAELASTPYKTLKYHTAGVRKVRSCAGCIQSCRLNHVAW